MAFSSLVALALKQYMEGGGTAPSPTLSAWKGPDEAAIVEKVKAEILGPLAAEVTEAVLGLTGPTSPAGVNHDADLIKRIKEEVSSAIKAEIRGYIEAEVAEAIAGIIGPAGPVGVDNEATIVERVKAEVSEEVRGHPRI